MEFFFLYVFPFGFIAMGIAAVWSGLRQLRLARASRCWPFVTGVVRQSEVLRAPDGEGGIRFLSDVAYEYQVSGQHFRSTQIAFGDVATARQDDAERRVSRYPAGAAVQVFYDPSEPTASVLERAPEEGVSLFIGAGLLFIVVGIALIFLMPAFFREFHKVA